MGKKMSGTADYIIPLAVVGLGVFVLYKLGFIGNSSGSGSGGGGLLSPLSSSPATQQATLSLDDTAVQFYQAQPTATSPFLPTLYNSNTACPSITSDEASSLWSDVQTAYNGSGFLSIFKAQPDMSPLLAQFQTYVQSACDISLVSLICQQATGSDLGTFMFNSFANDQTGSSGQTNMTMLYNFIQWAFALPTGLD
jgi:hypothetical protein